MVVVVCGGEIDAVLADIVNGAISGSLRLPAILSRAANLSVEASGCVDGNLMSDSVDVPIPIACVGGGGTLMF